MLLASTVAGLSGCGSGAPAVDQSATLSLTGYEVPSKIAAVPASTSNAARVVHRSIFAALTTSAADLPVTSDYLKTASARFVDEKALDSFDIIGTILGALAQTRYFDIDVLNKGPYRAMVEFKDKGSNGGNSKSLEEWTVDSKMVQGTLPDGTQGGVNEVSMWVPNEGGGSIKAKFSIFKAGNVAESGDISSYGVWDFNVSFGQGGAAYFRATAREENGMSVIRVSENTESSHLGGGCVLPVGDDGVNNSVLYRSGTSGYGKLSVLDQSWGNNTCTIKRSKGAYAYNASYLAYVLDANNNGNLEDDAVVYKDRNSKTTITRDYGVFYADAGTVNGRSVAAGDAVRRHNRFGFPVYFDDMNGQRIHSYYGAWQGRHQLWVPHNVALPTTVYKENFGNKDAAPEAFTVNNLILGTLTKRVVSDASLNDIKNVAVQTFENKWFGMGYNSTAGGWQSCDGQSWFNATDSLCHAFQSNATSSPMAVTMAQLKIINPEDTNVMINGPSNTQYVYLDAAMPGFTFTGVGLYDGHIQFSGGAPTIVPGATGTKLAPSNGTTMNVSINNRIYISYMGGFDSTYPTGWVGKVRNGGTSWEPTFDNTKDYTYTMEVGREMYINAHGSNYIVRRTASVDVVGSYVAKLEIQIAATPKDITLATFLPTATAYLSSPNDSGAKLLPNGTDFLLHYTGDNPSTAATETTATVLTTGAWGLFAYDVSGNVLDKNGQPVAVTNGWPAFGSAAVQFNWDYASNGDWGAQRFLSDANGRVYLSNPISFTATTLTTEAAEVKTLLLQFDGWMHGLPDVYRDLEKNNFVVDSTIKAEIVNIPEGQVLTDDASVRYFVKPLNSSVFLDIVANPSGAPSLTTAKAMTFSDMPPSVIQDNGMSAKPTGTAVLYSEGVPVSGSAQ